MNLKLNGKVGIIIGLFTSLGMTVVAHAAMPQPINMKDVVSMSFDQRLAHTKEINSAVLNSTPQEINEYFAKTVSQIKALSPADKKYIAEKREANWRALTPEQRNKLRLQQRAFIKAMPPEVQRDFTYYASGRELH